MEGIGLPAGGLFSNLSSGMLGLEMSLNHHQNLPQQSPHHFQQQHHPHMISYDHHHPQSQQPSKRNHQSAPRSKAQQLTLSDDDDHGIVAEGSHVDGKRKVSPWQRMKWTDDMVRLLIMVVFYIGDEAGSEDNNPIISIGMKKENKKKKSGGMLLQKKGKWRSVSWAMMERGFYVSPQQCEDKFNDLNKRYKRVNDILGKGTACRVVENQNLLESMDLSPKLKEEVRKLLNSKHLFFREMCAYHTSCSGAGGNGGVHSSPAAEKPSQNQSEPLQQLRCLHSSEDLPNFPHSSRVETEGSKLEKGESGEYVNDGEYEKDGDDNDDEYEKDGDDNDDDEVVEVEAGGRGVEEDEEEEEEEEEEEGDGDKTERKCWRKRQRNGMETSISPAFQKFSDEITSVIQDGTRSLTEKRMWVKTRMRKMEEQRVGYQCRAFELEKQRFKWLKFSSNKERETYE